MSFSPPKPKTETYRPELTRLPELTSGRRAIRKVLHIVIRAVVRLCLRLRVDGVANIPSQGPLLVVSNHLGDADLLVGMAVSPRPCDIFGKVELYDIPIVGKLMDLYGTIWVHRGRSDRRAIRAALKGLSEGRFLAIAPEGRESLTGALEAGTGGAAYLALKAGVPVLPIAVTGTENWRIYGNLKRLRRTDVLFRVGKPFDLPAHTDRKTAVRMGTEKIMLAVARLLPEEYRGIYRDAVERKNDSETA